MGPAGAGGGPVGRGGGGGPPRRGPAPGLPPGRGVLVEQRGDGVLDPRRELAHGLVRPRHQRLAEPDRQLAPAGRRPALPARHRGERAAVGDRHHGDVVLLGEEGGTHPEPAEPAVDRPGALGVDHQAPALGEHLARGGRHGAAAAVDREGVEQQRGADRAPPGVEEVVRRGGHRRTPAPLVGQREQDQRRVEVGGVVRDEDDRAVDPREHVEALDAGTHLGAEQRLEADPLGDLAGGHRGTAARPLGAEHGGPGRQHPLLGRAGHLCSSPPAPATGDLTHVVDGLLEEAHRVTGRPRAGAAGCAGR